MAEDSDHETSQIIVDTAANTVYENRLRVRGREGGDYKCTVRNTHGDSGSSRVSSFAVDGRLLQFRATSTCVLYSRNGNYISPIYVGGGMWLYI